MEALVGLASDCTGPWSPLARGRAVRSAPRVASRTGGGSPMCSVKTPTKKATASGGFLAGVPTGNRRNSKCKNGNENKAEASMVVEVADSLTQQAPDFTGRRVLGSAMQGRSTRSAQRPMLHSSLPADELSWTGHFRSPLAEQARGPIGTSCQRTIALPFSLGPGRLRMADHRSSQRQDHALARREVRDALDSIALAPRRAPAPNPSGCACCCPCWRACRPKAIPWLHTWLRSRCC